MILAGGLAGAYHSVLCRWQTSCAQGICCVASTVQSEMMFRAVLQAITFNYFQGVIHRPDMSMFFFGGCPPVPSWLEPYSPTPPHAQRSQQAGC
jgi:hypothetical protein